MPWRPARITNLPKEAAHVINQLFRETNGRIDNIENAPVKTISSTKMSFPKGLQVGPTTNTNFVTSIFKNQQHLVYTTIGGGQCQDQHFSSPNATQSGAVFASPSADLGSPHLSWSGWVSSPGIVSVRVCNPTGGSITPNPVIWNTWTHT